MSVDIEEGASSPLSKNFSDDHCFEQASVLLCLETLAHLNGRPLSIRTILAGLPQENILHTFIRAAHRIDLEAQPLQLPLEKIELSTLPCVLLLKENQACVLLEIDKKQTAKVIFPEKRGNEPENISLKDLLDQYSGTCFLIKPLYSVSDPETGHKSSKRSHWLLDLVYHFRTTYYQVAIASFLTNVFTLLIPLFTMNVYDRVISHKAFATLWVFSIGIITVLIFDFVLKIIKSHFTDVASKNIDIILSSQLLEKILGIKLSDYPLSVGSLVSHIREMEVLREFLSSVVLLSFIDIPFAVLFLLVIWYIGGILVLVTVVCVLLILCESWIFSKIVAHYTRNATTESNRKNSFLVEIIIGLESIKAFCAQSKLQEYWEGVSETHSKNIKYGNFFSSLAINMTNFLQNLNYVCLVIVGVFLVIDGKMTVGGLIACSILAGRVTAPFAQAVVLIMRLNYVKISYQTIGRIMSLPTETSQDKVYISLPKISGNIRFEGIDFSYPGQKQQSLKNFSLTITPGEKIAVLGKIGSGKTTLEKLLLGFYEPNKGSILIEGLDSRQIDPTNLRSNIGYVPQDIQLFAGILRENILLGARHVTPEQLLKALEVAGIIDFIRSHPLGLDMQIGEGGRQLSGGQRQAVALARAIINDPPIFLFDEPTNMMDQGSEEKIIQHLKNITEDKTFVVVTHTTSFLNIVNRVLILDQGTLVYDGAKNDFLARMRAQNGQQKSPQL